MKYILLILKQLFCKHSWQKSTKYVDIFYDICEKCGKRRDTNQDNLEYTHFKFPKITLLLILIFLPLSAMALTYQENGFETYGTRETGLVFNTPKKNSFSIFIGQDFGTFAMEKEPTNGWRKTECIIIRNGKQDECSLQEFSILMYHFSKEFIEGLGI